MLNTKIRTPAKNGFAKNDIWERYFKQQNQNARIYDDSVFQTSLSEVSQGSALLPLLFNIVLNDVLVVLKMSQLYDFANDNIIPEEANNSEGPTFIASPLQIWH